MKRRRAKRVQTVSGTSNDCSRGDGRRRWSLNSYASIGKQKARIGGTRNERWSPERRACFFARLRKQTCQTSVDLLDHKRRRLFLHRSGSRFFINIQAKPAVSQARSAAEGTFIFTALWPSSDSRYTKRDDYFTRRPLRASGSTNSTSDLHTL